MLKFHSALTAGLATLLVAPTVLQDDDLAILEHTLAKTDQALEILRGLHPRFDTDAQGAGRLLLAATEPPVLDEQLRDERLVALREEVSILRSELDRLQAPDELPPLESTTPEGTVVNVPFDMPGTGPLALTREEALRRAMEPKTATRPRTSRPTTEPGMQEPPPPEAVAVDARPLPEGKDYSADPLGHARACYRAGRYQQGLALLRGHEDPVSMYWRARCLEKLERLQEAVTTLEKVIEKSPDSAEARRARTDLEFLRWKQGFVKNLPKGMKGGQGQ